MKAQIPGYPVAGKTGTARKAPYDTGEYIASFVGFAPADNPRLAAIVVIDHPRAASSAPTPPPPCSSRSCSTRSPTSGCPPPREAAHRDASHRIGTPARYPVAFDPETEPRGRARVRWHDLLAGLDVVELTGDPDVEVAAITHDSRRVTPGACFACIPGAVTDGHDHAAAAVAAGAVALLVERPLPLAVPQARVPSVRAALGPVAAGSTATRRPPCASSGSPARTGRRRPRTCSRRSPRGAGERIGVIGTVGARSSATGGGDVVETWHTTPEATSSRRCWRGCATRASTTVAMEVSSHALDQHRVDGTRFAAVCFTNLSHDHLDYHGSLEAYFEAKATLFDPARATRPR